MKVSELRAALAEQNVRWADLLEKRDIAARFAELRAQAPSFRTLPKRHKVGIIC